MELILNFFLSMEALYLAGFLEVGDTASQPRLLALSKSLLFVLVYYNNVIIPT